MSDLIFRVFESVFTVFGIIGVCTLAGAFVSYWIFKYLGSKWLDGRFAERLEAFKHRQNLEIENAKYEFSKWLDRSAKLHQNEFTHIPGAWGKLVEAFYYSAPSLNAFQEYGQLAGTPDDAVRRYLETKDYSADAIDRIMRSPDRQGEFQRAEDRSRLEQAYKYHQDFIRYLFANQIFIRPEISGKFDEMAELIRFALIERESEIAFPGQHRSSFPAIRKYRDEGQRMMRELENLVRDQLADSLAWAGAARTEGRA